ncbi:MAG: thioredoxin family protein [Vicinamibacterales bacterium]
MKTRFAVAAIGLLSAVSGAPGLLAQEQTIRVELVYMAPGSGPAPNFSPKGTQIQLAPVAANLMLPPDASLPAKTGVIKVGPDEHSWISLLTTADPTHPADLTRLYIDRNRNGRFDDDGPPATAVPAQNEKTKAWWTSTRAVELSIPYPGATARERYLVNFWSVREDSPGTPPQAPQILRYSVGSWRSGTVTVNGTAALVAAMDGDNNGVFDKNDSWSVLEADAPDAAKQVLSHTEARVTTRLMYISGSGREQVLEFRAFAADGRWIELAVVNRMSTKKEDRAADDIVAAERSRPRAAAPFAWSHDFKSALAAARKSNRTLLIDFEATWCGPCKTMDEWIWTDAEVAGLLTSGFVGVKIDGDLEKALADRFRVTGYPSMIVLDANGTEARRFVGYLNSTDAVAFLKR